MNNLHTATQNAGSGRNIQGAEKGLRSLLAFAPVLSKHKAMLAWVLFSAVMMLALGLGQFLGFRWLMDRVLSSGDYSLLALCAAVFVCISLSMVFFQNVRARLSSLCSSKLDLDLSESYLRQVTGLSFQAYLHFGHTELAAKAEEMGKIRQALVALVLALLFDGPVCLGLLVALLASPGVPAVAVLLPLPLLLLVFSLFSKPMRRAHKRSLVHNSLLRSGTAEHSKHLMELRILGCEQASLERIKAGSQNAAQSSLGLGRVMFGQSMLSGFLDSSMYLGVLFGIAGAVLAGLTSPGGLFSLLILFSFFSAALRRLFHLQPQVLAARASAARVLMLWDRDLQEPRRNTVLEFLAARPGLQLEDASFVWPGRDKKQVLQDINLGLLPGDWLGIHGPSGSGKTTFTRLLAGLIEPSSGTIRLGGQDIRHLSRETLRSHIGLVSQTAPIFSGSLRDNLSMQNPAINDTQLYALLKRLGLDRLLQSLPRGLDTTLLSEGQQLSGGERQRILLARVLLTDTQIIILDEVSSALDPKSLGLVLDLLGELRRAGKIIISIAHDNAALRSCTMLCNLEEGQLYPESRDGIRSEMRDIAEGTRELELAR